MNAGWQNRPSDPSHVSRASGLRRLILVCKVWQVLMLVAAVFVVQAFLAEASRTPDVILESGDGRTYRGKPVPFSVTREMFQPEAEAIIEGLFLITEKGPVDGLAPYVHDAVLEKYRQAYRDVIREDKGFYQAFKVAESRIMDSGPLHANVAFRGYLSSRGLTQATAGVETYIVTQFRKTKSTADNPLGYWLYGILPSNKEEFYSKELDEIRRKALDQAGGSQAPTGSQNAAPKSETK